MTPSFRHRIPMERLHDPSSLFGNFVTRADGAVATALGGFDGGSPAWKQRLDAPAGRGGDGRRRFFESMAEYNRALGVGAGVVDRLGRVASGAARVVITGQQPGVLGGPLMSLYKIETAIALAARVERDHGVPCVPVYWMGADDTDFAEVRELVMLNADYQMLATSLPTGAHDVAMPVGDIDVKWLRQIWDGIDAFVGGFDGGERVVSAVDSALSSAADHGGVAARVVAALTGGEVAVVDARDGLLREAAHDVILEYFDGEDDVKREVADGGSALQASGFHAQLSLGPDSGVFILEAGRRTKVADDRRAEARARIERDPSCAYPGVVLRNLVQDAVFDPVAVVLGPAEVAYRAQIRGVYERFGMPMPVSFPRMFASYVPPAVARLAGEMAADAGELAMSTPAFVQRVFALQSDARLDGARRDLEATMASRTDDFLATAALSMDDLALGKMRKRLADVSRRFSQALSSVGDVGRARALARWPFLDGLPDVFSLRGAPQERYLSMLTPFLFGGCTSDACVRSVAREHVDAAMDAGVDHIVYSD